MRWQWLVVPLNASLSVFAEVPPYSDEDVTVGSLPTFVDTRSLLKDRIIYP